jgi:hypothetical protein
MTMTQLHCDYEFTYGGRVHCCSARGSGGETTMPNDPLASITGFIWWYVDVDGTSSRTIQAGPRDLVSEASKGTLRIRILNSLRDQGLSE